jgi:hypothetical protein
MNTTDTISNEDIDYINSFVLPLHSNLNKRILLYITIGGQQYGSIEEFPNDTIKQTEFPEELMGNYEMFYGFHFDYEFHRGLPFFIDNSYNIVKMDFFTFVFKENQYHIFIEKYVNFERNVWEELCRIFPVILNIYESSNINLVIASYCGDLSVEELILRTKVPKELLINDKVVFIPGGCGYFKYKLLNINDKIYCPFITMFNPEMEMSNELISYLNENYSIKECEYIHRFVYYLYYMLMRENDDEYIKRLYGHSDIYKLYLDGKDNLYQEVLRLNAIFNIKYENLINFILSPYYPNNEVKRKVGILREKFL